ncbi:MAG TPA: hypothetical protein DCO79_01345 [Spirochaeta sp.]|nr:hypothetical protein [Spirochaeta sp.]
MYRKSFRWVVLAVVLLLFIDPVFASDESALKLGVCRFDYLGEREEALASGISSRFFETVSGIRDHKTNPEEIAKILSLEKEELIIQNIISLEKLYSEKDKLIFTVSEDNLSSELEKKNAEIERKKTDIEELKQENETSGQNLINESGFIPLDILKPDDGFVFTRIPGAITESAREYGLDFIVYGFLETIDDYEYLEARLWNNILGKDIYIWRTALETENINDLIRPGLKGIKTVLLGRNWAEISLRGPENTMIYINGKFTGIGSVNRVMVEPGNVDIELKKAGSESKSVSIVLENAEFTELEYELNEVDAGTVIIQTWPAGADIYLDSVWTGHSPLRLEPQNETSAVRIKMDGFEERNFFINGETERLINMNLKPLSAGREDLIPESRKRFYSSMGSFIISIPLTSLFSSMIDQSKSAYNREMALNGAGAETDRLFKLNRAEYALYLVSSGLNVIMLLDTIIQAVDYVSSVEYFSD